MLIVLSERDLVLLFFLAVAKTLGIMQTKANAIANRLNLFDRLLKKTTYTTSNIAMARRIIEITFPGFFIYFEKIFLIREKTLFKVQ